MRTFHIYHIGPFMGLLLMMPFSLSAQQRNPFRALAEENRSQQVCRTLSASDTISLEGLGTIYSLSIDATIHQPKEASFTRIVLEDIKGHEYLVAESDWFRNDTTEVHLDHYCEETALLEGITPRCLKCYLADQATINLTGIYTSNQPITRSFEEATAIARTVKYKQIRDIVDRINTYNTRHQKLWRAGINELITKSYSEQKSIINTDGANTYLASLSSYAGGIYELGERNDNIPEPTSNCVDSFDRNNRHGKSWLSPVKNQWLTPFCQTFAVVAMTESAVKTYYNDTTAVSLSEQDVVSYNFNTDTINNGWAKMISPINYIREYGVIDDATLPFDGFNSHPSLIIPRPDGEEKISFNSYWVVMNIEGADNAKRFLILYGPSAVGLQLPSGSGHAMLLYGYGKISAGMNYGDGENPDIISNTDPRIGRTIWKFKNSWGNTWGENGLVNVVCYNWELLNSFYYINGQISSLTRNDADIICEDADGDGYFFWGINHSAPSTLPSWAPLQEDADDSDAHVGPFTSFLGFTKDINPENIDTIFIDHDTIFSQKKYIANHIRIQNNSSLHISHQLTMNRLSKIIIDSGSSLIIDGGIIRHPVICPEPGGTIIINNGGKIIPYKGVSFTLPVGVNFQINHGSIESYE